MESDLEINSVREGEKIERKKKSCPLKPPIILEMLSFAASCRFEENDYSLVYIDKDELYRHLFYIS
jgi:hypothetical protein